MKKVLKFTLYAAGAVGGVLLARKFTAPSVSRPHELHPPGARVDGSDDDLPAGNESFPHGSNELTAAQEEDLLEELENQLGA